MSSSSSLTLTTISSSPTVNTNKRFKSKAPMLQSVVSSVQKPKEGPAPTRAKSKNASYTGKLLDTLICAECHFRAFISTMYSFPPRAQLDHFIKGSWTKATSEIGEPFELTKDLAAVVCPSLTRTLVLATHDDNINHRSKKEPLKCEGKSKHKRVA